MRPYHAMKKCHKTSCWAHLQAGNNLFHHIVLIMQPLYSLQHMLIDGNPRRMLCKDVLQQAHCQCGMSVNHPLPKILARRVSHL